MIDHGAAAADVGRDGGAGDAELRERTEPEDEARSEDDVQEVAEPQDPHRNCGVAGSAEDRVDQEQHDDRRVAAEHGAREYAPRADHVLRRAHHGEQRRRVRRGQNRDGGRDDQPEHDRLPRRARGAVAIVLAHAARDERGRADRQPHRGRVDDRQHRLGQADRRQFRMCVYHAGAGFIIHMPGLACQ